MLLDFILSYLKKLFQVDDLKRKLSNFPLEVALDFLSGLQLLLGGLALFSERALVFVDLEQ